MLVPERHHTDTRYRYGFQGQEKDDEVKGEGNSINYTFRMHDPRVGRFFATDPLFRDYPHYTPYSFSGNKVINAVEIEGLEEQVIVDNALGLKRKNNDNYFILDGKQALSNELFGPVLQSLKNVELINETSRVSFIFNGFTTKTITSTHWYGKSTETFNLLRYDIHFIHDGLKFKIPIELNSGTSTYHPGGNVIDYALLTVGTGAWGKAFEKVIKVKVQQAITKHFTGLLAKAGIKHSVDDILKIGRDQLNKIIFLEKGNTSAGLEHIMRHVDDFVKNGIAEEDIAEFVFEAATKGKVVGYQGQGTGRPIYEYLYKGETKRVAVTIGDNGFIVGANPVSAP